MAKAAKVLCDRCEHRITVGDPFCGTCGCPTGWANHDERVAWELAQYRDKTMNSPVGTAFERPAPTAVLEKTKGGRRLRLFSRRTHATKITPPEPKRTEPGPAVLKAVPSEPKPATIETKAEPKVAPTIEAKPSAKVERPVERTVPRPAERAVARTAERTVARPKPSARDKEPLRDTPATVLAMRMLNARVAELDAKIEELSRELESLQERRRA